MGEEVTEVVSLANLLVQVLNLNDLAGDYLDARLGCIWEGGSDRGSLITSELLHLADKGLAFISVVHIRVKVGQSLGHTVTQGLGVSQGCLLFRDLGLVSRGCVCTEDFHACESGSDVFNFLLTCLTLGIELLQFIELILEIFIDIKFVSKFVVNLVSDGVIEVIEFALAVNCGIRNQLLLNGSHFLLQLVKRLIVDILILVELVLQGHERGELISVQVEQGSGNLLFLLLRCRSFYGWCSCGGFSLSGEDCGQI